MARSNGSALIRRKARMAPQQRTCTIVGGLFAVVCVYLVYQMTSSSSSSNDWFDVCPSEAYVTALTQHATGDRFVVLALVDAAFVDMAVNLYESSLKPFGIENFLFVGAGRRACEMLANASLPCFHYTEDRDAEVPSTYQSPDFVRKMNIRTDMILDALTVDFTVLHTDLDVVFLRNPIPELRTIAAKADIATLWDSVAYNAGFVVVRPTWFSKKIYREMKSMTGRSVRVDDQTALNAQISRMNALYRFRGFSAVALSTKKYLCGLDYYEGGRRFFAANCSDCVVVHNNWIVGREAKIYRFKEHLHWMYDKDSYYTGTEHAYLTYANPVVWPNKTASVSEELTALKAALALGHLLDRIVILPRFHCTAADLGVKLSTKTRGKGGPSSSSSTARSKPKESPRIECPLNGLLNITAFDGVFGGRYRESSFLQHPLVRDEIRTDLSASYLVVHAQNRDFRQRLVASSENGSFHEISLPEGNGSLSEKQVVKHFGKSANKVLVFHSLYRTVPDFMDADKRANFERKVKQAFQLGQYRQL